MTICQRRKYWLKTPIYIVKNYYFTVIAQLEIRITIRCNDGHNCAGISDSINDASEEVLTQQGGGTRSDIEKILADFKSRVDPEDFVQYLTRLKEEDEVNMLYSSNTILFNQKYYIHYLTNHSIKSYIARLGLCVSYTHYLTRKFMLYKT